MLRKTKRRYLAVNINCEANLQIKQLMDTVWSAITKLYGEYGASQSGLAIIEYEVNKKIAVLRVNNSATSIVRASLATITRIADTPAAVHVLVTSGTLKALREKANDLSRSPEGS